jgi:hypothetical protein
MRRTTKSAAPNSTSAGQSGLEALLRIRISADVAERRYCRSTATSPRPGSLLVFQSRRGYNPLNADANPSGRTRPDWHIDEAH